MVFNKTMREKITLKKVIDFVKLSLFLTGFWPLPKGVNKSRIVCVALYHYASVILHIALSIGMINEAINHLDDPAMIVKSMVFVCATWHVICNIISYKFTSHHLQLVTFELENFCKLMDSREEAICQQYIDKCYTFYGVSIICIYLITIATIAGPAIIEQPFPTNVKYSFDIYRQPIRSIIYIHQSFCALQATAHICLNTFTALLLWFTSARFEMLTEKLRAVTNIYVLMKCIQEHQKLLKYADHLVRAVRPFAFISIGCSTSGIITLSLIFITDQPWSIKFQCVGLVFSGLSEVFMFTWPAEHLIHISNEIGEAIYNAKWYGQSLELQRSLQIVLMRARKPVIVKIPCLLPTLSLSYYASYLSTIFSYFTTLRMFMQTNGDMD